MDQLRAMRTFARVIDEGSFAGAARELDTAPAVVTRIIAELEEHLGARLINRTTRRLALTDVGERYLERVRKILVEVDDAAAQANLASGEASGHLRVLIPPALSVHQVVPQLPRFRRAYPNITLEFHSQGPVETVDENFDVTVIMINRLEMSDADFVARCLAHTEIVTCATPAYLDRRGRPAHPSEISGHDAIVPTTASLHREMRFVRPAAPGCEPDSVSLKMPVSILDSTHMDTNYAAALHGLGIAGLPSFVIGDALRSGALERVLPGWRLLTLSIWAAMPTRKHVPLRTRVFVDFLVEVFGGEPRDPWLIAAGCETPGVAVE